MLKLKLIVDDREHAIIPFFKTIEHNEIEIEIKRIQVGDYVIMQGSEILYCIERKSWTDLSASIKDGRSENVTKMIKLREQTQCKLLYLMEGKSRYTPAKKFARIPYKNLQAKLDHLIMRDNVYIIYSNNAEDTPHRLVEFMVNHLSLNLTVNTSKQTSTIEGGADVNSETLLTTVVAKTDLEIIRNIWSAVPNITSKTALLFIDKYHISDLFLGNITQATIAAMQYAATNTVIGKRSSKIIAVVNNEDINNFPIYCKLIAEIPGITKKTAALILLKVTFNDLLAGKLSIVELSQIKKTEKSLIGITVATRIFKFLVKHNKE